MPPLEIIEVGPRDGLQNECANLTLVQRKTLIENLMHAGLKRIEVGACVSPQKVPQMAQSTELAQSIKPTANTSLSLLVPNQRGLDDALATRVGEIAVFTACSDGFTRANIGCDRATALARFKDLVSQAKQQKRRVRGYLSTIIECPYDGPTPPSDVVKSCEQLLAIGCDEISLGETLGVATPFQIQALLKQLLKHIPVDVLALHCHDTYGQALANVWVGLELGICKFDAAIAGLGGCPFAKGASGNLATEDLIYLLQSQGAVPEINLAELARIGKECCDWLGRETHSRAGTAILS